jgi:hypothetical protein
MDTKSKTLFDVCEKHFAFQMKDYPFGMSWNPTFFIGLYFNRILKKKSIIFYQPFLHLLVEGINIYIHPSFFHFLKHSFCVKT